ncbi:MAG TPA: hypothetical protein DCL54_13735 [Alphaproteobacteria bacterium]|nr:hypothetical protein [Alphaproteobacteria bacterium]HAJ47630.1 hypothetical protein [Alphaproteobacteria bacterium]
MHFGLRSLARCAPGILTISATFLAGASANASPPADIIGQWGALSKAGQEECGSQAIVFTFLFRAVDADSVEGWARGGRHNADMKNYYTVTSSTPATNMLMLRNEVTGQIIQVSIAARRKDGMSHRLEWRPTKPGRPVTTTMWLVRCG